MAQNLLVQQKLLQVLMLEFSGYKMYLEGQEFKDGDGIVVKGVENTIRNVARLGKIGMKETDKEIIKIMMGC